jgi:hypothetical protein
MTKEHLEWLEAQGLLETAKVNSVHFKKVLIECLNVQKDENVLIIGDVGFKERMLSPIFSTSYFFAAKELGLNARLILQEPKLKGDEADKEVSDALYNFGQGNILILCLSGKLGSMGGSMRPSYRIYCKENNHRFASTTNLSSISTNQAKEVIDAIDIDYKLLQQKGNELKEIFDKGKEIHVTTEAGTDLYFKVDGKKAISNTGEYTKQRTGGNIPTGEIYMPPKWKHVNGRVVIDGSYSYRHGTQLIKNPIRIDIEKDEITDIKGFEEADNLKETLNWAYKTSRYPWGVKRVGEFGLGINPFAKIIGVTTVDEKSLGTAHIGIGSNYWFGGTIYTKIHIDQIFRNPKVYVDGELLNLENLYGERKNI